MVLEMKSLRAKATTAAKHVGDLHRAYDEFNTAAPAHASDVKSLTGQVGEMQDDLKFATTTLGNSVGAETQSQSDSDKGEADRKRDSGIVIKPEHVAHLSEAELSELGNAVLAKLNDTDVLPRVSNSSHRSG